MITRIVRINGDNFISHPGGECCRHAEYYGKSTDTKPVEGVKNAEIFYEMDTKKIFMFDEENAVWLEQ